MHVPTGRYEKRTTRAVTIEFLRLDESHLDESQLIKSAVTEDVSPRGARIVTDWNCAPGKHLLVSAPKEGVKSLARVVYCQRLESTKFAVGLQFVVRVEEEKKSKASSRACTCAGHRRDHSGLQRHSCRADEPVLVCRS